MLNFEELKRKINDIDKEIAILNHDLKRANDCLKKTFGLTSKTNEIEACIKSLEKKDERILMQIQKLRLKAENILKDIEI